MPNTALMSNCQCNNNLLIFFNVNLFVFSKVFRRQLTTQHIIQIISMGYDGLYYVFKICLLSQHFFFYLVGIREIQNSVDFS